jgi:hypothetical protein
MLKCEHCGKEVPENEFVDCEATEWTVVPHMWLVRSKCEYESSSVAFLCSTQCEGLARKKQESDIRRVIYEASLNEWRSKHVCAFEGGYCTHWRCRKREENHVKRE